MNDIEEIKVLLTEIRDEQRAHREEWKRAYTENQQLREKAVGRIKQAKSNQKVLLIILLVLAACTVVPIIQWAMSWAIFDAYHR